MLCVQKILIVNGIWFVRVWRMEHVDVNAKHNIITIMKEDDVVRIWFIQKFNEWKLSRTRRKEGQWEY
jgi:hypothetical protein